jgi:hypothetical protein
VTEAELRPDQLPEVLIGEADPFAGVKAAAEQAGLPVPVLERMIKRIRAQYQPVVGELKQVHTGELVKLLDDRAQRALLWMDDEVLAKSSAKDLAIIAGIMLEKRALLRGEPTQILSVDDRQSMNDLIPQVLAEAQKRGMFVDVLEGCVDVTPGHEERQWGPRAKTSMKTKAAKHKAKVRAESGESGS